MKENKLVNLENAREDQQRERMENSERLKVCIFCTEGLKEIHKLPILKENKTFLVTDNAFPYQGTLHHVLIIPKAHISNISELGVEEWCDMKEMIDWVIKDRKIDGGSLFIRFGDSSYNCGSLNHLHIHIIVGNASQYNVDEKNKIQIPLGWKNI